MKIGSLKGVMDRRDFIKNGFVAGAAAALGGSALFAGSGCRSSVGTCQKRNNKQMKNPVMNGIDNIQAVKNALKNYKIGLVTNPSAIDRECRTVADLLAAENRVEVFFAPEHGIRGDLQNGVKFDDSIDPIYKKKVYSLYRPTLHLTEERVKDIDAIVYDIQDVGSRAFSYLRTLAFLIEDCAKLNKELIVLDRINPLGLEAVEGVMPEGDFDKRWGYGIPWRFGLTHGEYAKMVNKRYFNNACRLTVVPCSNLKRDMMFDDMDLFWSNPSPNLPNFTSALLYAGCTQFGQTNISEARGTTRPYEMYGAPFVDAYKVAAELNKLKLKGVFFRPCAFTAEYNAFKKYLAECCRGVQIFVTDSHAVNTFEMGMWMLEVFRSCCKEFAIPFPNGRCDVRIFDPVLGSSDWRLGKQSTASFIARGAKESAEFKKSVKEFWIY